jgi:microcystin-dependent protein
VNTTPILGLPYPELADSVDVPRDVQALAEAVETQGTFIVGEMRQMLRRTIPAAWLLCDGRAVSRAQYAALYDEIGAWVGAGDGSSTFNLPDVAGRALVGAGAGAGLTARAVGTKWGVEAVVLSKAQLPAHNHGGASGSVDLTHTHTKPFEPGLGYVNAVQGSFAELVLGSGSSLAVRYDSATTGAADRSLVHGHSIANDGGGAGHDNTPPSFAAPVYIYAGAL